MTMNETSLDILDGCEMVPIDDNVDLDNKDKFTKLSLTKSQHIQVSALMSQLPALASVGMLSKAMMLRFPDGVPGVLMQLKNGGYSTTLRNVETGKITGTAWLESAAPQAVCLAAFSAMSIASGQYFLAQINNSLAQISSGLDKILEFLYGDKRAELLSEVSFIRFAYENYQAVMEHSEQRIATLISLQNARKVAMKDIEFYLSDLSSIMSEKRSNDISATVSKMIRTKDCLDLSLQLYTMSNLLEVYYSENFDSNYISFVQSEASSYIAKCEKRLLKYLGQLQHLLTESKGLFAKSNKADCLHQIDDMVLELEASNLSPLQMTLKSALSESNKERDFYLSQDGNVYLKVS